MGKTIDIAGQRFGRVIVLERVEETDKNRNTYWLCRCNCGEKKVIRGNCLRSGAIRSCGCLSHETKTKHGYRKEKLYPSWKMMLARCYNPDNKSYPNYGGRKILVCKSWHNFKNFAADMGERPEGHSIDRINNEMGYHCGRCEECIAKGWVANCRWATATTQIRNRRIAKSISVNGKTMTVKEASEITGISSKLIYERLSRGLSDVEALKVR